MPIGLENVYKSRLDTSKWDYSQLIDPYGFRWEYGITPFSDWQIIVGSWALYFTTIFGLKTYMSSRTAFSLKYITALHNFILSAWSAGMFIYAVIDFIDRWQTRGLPECFCTSDSSSISGRLFYTTYIYYLSKFYELFDTIILVLKKKQLIFLHWYHHAIVITMVWSWLEEANPYSTIGMIANTFIHIFMYYYYFSASLGRSIWFKKYITTGQIIQFFIAFLLGIPYLYFHFTRNCVYGINAFITSMTCNATFLILFIRFYRKTYSRKDKKSEQEKKKD